MKKYFLPFFIASASFAYGDFSADIEKIYQEEKSNPLKFSQKLEELMNQYQKENKLNEIEKFEKILEKEPENGDSFHGIFDSLMMGNRITKEQEKIISEYKRLYEKIKRIKNQVQSNSLNDFQSIAGKRKVGGSISVLSPQAFKQGTSNGACALYSFLYTASRIDSLKNIFNDIIYADSEGNYYVVDRGNSQYYEISKEKIQNAEADLNPSELPILRAVGAYAKALYVQETKNNDMDAYILSIEGKDIFFNRPVKNFSGTAAKNVVFNQDGSLNFGDQKISKGDYVVSIGLSTFGGHAVAAYYNQSEKKWKLFDNLQGNEQDISNLNKEDIINITLIGFVG